MRKFFTTLPWLEILNGVAAVVSLIAFVGAALGNEKALAAVMTPYLAAVILVAFCTYAFFTARKQRYSAITRQLQGLSTRCRLARNRISMGDDVLAENSKFRDDLSVILNYVSEIYTLLTRSPCRAAIKAFRPLPTPGWYVFTIARDHASAESHKHGDRRRAAARFDTLDKNPHLLSLFSDEVDSEDWACFNNVPKQITQGRYASSSLLWLMNISHQAGGATTPHKLPYKAALVALVRNKGDAPIAFLGIDTNRRKVFQPEIDGPLLAAIGGYIGPLLDEAFAALTARPPPAASPATAAPQPSPSPPTNSQSRKESEN